MSELSELSTLRRTITALTARHDAAREVERRERAAHAAAVDEWEAAQQARELAQETARVCQANATGQVAAVVSRALVAVFPEEPYEFKVEFVGARGKTEARLVFVRDGVECSPMEAAGGGAVAVAAFALRLAALMLARPAKRRLLVLDEPLAHLSAEHVPAARVLLERLAGELGVQIILITHVPGLRCGKLVDLS